MPDDRVQREIEDILNRLDDFVPEETVASRMRRRSSGAAAGFGRAIIAPLARISLRHVMLTALALVVVAFFAMRVHPLVARWALIGGLILFFSSFALTFFILVAPPPTEKRWRGQPLALGQPSFGDRLRAWWERKRSRR